MHAVRGGTFVTEHLRGGGTVLLESIAACNLQM
jgi:hypothetical protein